MCFSESCEVYENPCEWLFEPDVLELELNCILFKIVSITDFISRFFAKCSFLKTTKDVLLNRIEHKDMCYYSDIINDCL